MAASLGFLALALGLASTAFAAGPVQLALTDAFSRAFESNRMLRTQRMAFNSAKFDYDDAWDRMFLPGITIELNTTSEYTLTQIADTPAKQLGPGAKSRGYPTSTAALSLGSYRIFNFWRDQRTYELAAARYRRAEERLREFERSLRFQVITAYFRLKTEQEKLDAAARSLEIAQAMRDLVQSKRRAGKATDTDVSSSTVDLLAAKNQHNDMLTIVQSAAWNLCLLLGDPLETNYVLTTDLKYTALRITPDQAVSALRERAPALRDARLDLRSSEVSLDLAEKNRLPLPTVSFNGVRVTYTNGYYGETSARSTDSVGSSGNFDVSASVSLSVPLLGPGGLFNSREVARAGIARETSETNLLQTEHSTLARTHSLITSIKQQEQNIANLTEAYKSTASLLDHMVSTGLTSSRLEWRDAINQTRQSEFALKDTILSHLTSKLDLAELIGMDKLEGDPYSW